MARKVIGIDGAATSTGIAVVSPREEGTKTDMVWSAQAIQIPGHTGLERAVRQVLRLDEILVSTKPELAVIEGYAYQNHHTLATLVEVGTCLRLALRRRDVPYIEVAPTRLKKFVFSKTPSAKGKTKKHKKALVATAVWKLWGFEHESDDVVDAYVLAQIGLLVIGAKTEGWKSWQLAMARDFS